MRTSSFLSVGVIFLLHVNGCAANDDQWVPDFGTADYGGGEVHEWEVIDPLDASDRGDAQQIDVFQDMVQDAADAVSDEGRPINTGLYEEGLFPDLASCEPGINTEYQRMLALDRLNYVRSLHGLSEVWYDESGDAEVAACALTCVSKRMLSHYPSDDWPCYSQDAADGCGSSNLNLQWNTAPDKYSTAGIVDGFIRDENVAAVGHRRWFLDPWLQRTAFARVDDYDDRYTAAAMKVSWGDSGLGSVGLQDGFVAYPFHDYPEALYNDKAHMSFTVVADKSSKWKNKEQIVFSAPTVFVKDEGGTSIPVTDIGHDNQGYGVPNCLWFKAVPTRKGVRYDVTISGISVNGKPMVYQYWFKRI